MLLVVVIKILKSNQGTLTVTVFCTPLRGIKILRDKDKQFCLVVIHSEHTNISCICCHPAANIPIAVL